MMKRTTVVFGAAVVIAAGVLFGTLGAQTKGADPKAQDEMAPGLNAGVYAVRVGGSSTGWIKTRAASWTSMN
jgi:hypothetical protein